MLISLYAAMKRSRVSACAVALIAVGCVPLPIPHKVTSNPWLTGRVVDGRSGSPVAGANVKVELRGDSYSATSADDGRFAIEPTQQWSYFWLVPLVPFDPGCAHAPLVVSVEGAAVCNQSYPGVEVCSPTNLLGDTGQLNRDHPQELGDIGCEEP